MASEAVHRGPVQPATPHIHVGHILFPAGFSGSV